SFGRRVGDVSAGAAGERGPCGGAVLGRARGELGRAARWPPAWGAAPGGASLSPARERCGAADAAGGRGGAVAAVAAAEGRMIVLRQAQDERGNWSRLAARLAAKAGKLAAAEAETRRRARRGDAR